jgi:type II secretory pathway component PulF
VPLTIYLAGFAILLVGVCRYYLIPALQAAGTATPRERQILAAESRLLMTVLLIVLLGVLFIILRATQRRRRGERKTTVYPDAWVESGRRLKTPPRNP